MADLKLSNRVKQVRITLNLNQSEFSSSLGVDQAYVSQLENGKASIRSKMILALSKKYKISIDWLLTGAGTMFINLNDKQALNAIEKMLNELKNQGVSFNLPK